MNAKGPPAPRPTPKARPGRAASVVEHFVMRCNPTAQIDAWITHNYDQWQFWLTVLSAETYDGLNKTRDEAQNLAGYYEGCYDMAIKFREFIGEKAAGA